MVRFMVSLREFLERREAEIRQQLKALRGELDEIKRAKAALEPSDFPAGSEPHGNTIKDLVRDILATKPEGATAHALLEIIQVKTGKTLARSSLSPQLSRLKDAEELELEGRTWRLRNVVQTQPNSAESSVDEFSELELDNEGEATPEAVTQNPFAEVDAKFVETNDEKGALA